MLLKRSIALLRWGATRSFWRSKYTCLAIETSCDDTGVAVLDSSGTILGETVHSQIRNTIRFGGVIPPIAAQFHRDALQPALNEVLAQVSSSFSVEDVDFIAVTYAPGIPISLRAGLDFAKKLAITYKKPLFPIHHMQAHALIPRLDNRIEFPFLVLLISGGHSLLVFVKSPLEFVLLGTSLDDAPGEIMDKTARLLKLQHLPEYQTVAGGHAVELISLESKHGPEAFQFPHVMTAARNCDFSFAGLKFHAKKLVLREERDFGTRGGNIVPSVGDICSSLQLGILRHFSNRLARAITFCDIKDMWPESKKTVIVSGGVASNKFFRSGISLVCETLGCNAVFPPIKYCTDNAVMIGWNAIERLSWRNCFNKEQVLGAPELLNNAEAILNLQPIRRIPIGEDWREAVEMSYIRAPRVRLKF